MSGSVTRRDAERQSYLSTVSTRRRSDYGNVSMTEETRQDQSRLDPDEEVVRVLSLSSRLMSFVTALRRSLVPTLAYKRKSMVCSIGRIQSRLEFSADYSFINFTFFDGGDHRALAI
jgi:regulation of enolase protein 1 (concanavalin A-like superfamily)